MTKYIISLGGSLICPNEIDEDFLASFKIFILKRLEFGDEFIIITGGGKLASKYVLAGASISEIDNEEKDWLGIHTTRLNAHLLRTIFKKWANPNIITNYEKDFEKLKNYEEKILIGGGWRPGRSTDYCATKCAEKYNIKNIINLSNIDYVYEEDPKVNPNAKRIENINWKDFRKIVGDKWDPRMNAPFDPIASKLCQELNIEVVILNGKNIRNIENYMNKKEFIGSVIKD